ncbi:hypothetical protein SAMN04489708_10873 [Paracidovorax cattleyae]|uniref:Uncharacterized protein n=1 Tax=Paracidovorax cattleyae TaxID=80868 RepID=A0A1H0QEP4_9BURK|nr:hypothetical protein SAMN04489708_10873 [Paracidovorax cattleyae]
MWAAVVVILFAGIPFIDMDLSTIQFDASRSQQCKVDVAVPQDTRWSNAFITRNNQSARVPVWWFLPAIARS